MIEALTLRGLEDGIQAEIIIEALTLRGLDDMNLSKDHDRGADSERT